MPRFVVLLRGVNVGKGNRVPMGELKTVTRMDNVGIVVENLDADRFRAILVDAGLFIPAGRRP